ncbi:hypothetical protein [Pseudogemmobacter sonorensis]|uniref:hypothetical protein n=1 Tax=Pseudogemmobacter sonorensis TaxID=2989681 RepID=UPI0036A739B9
MTPHLARASLVATRLELEAAKNQAALLGRLGLPAAVITVEGKLLVSNALMEAMEDVFVFAAHGRIALHAREATQRLHDAISASRPGVAGPQSLLLRGNETRPPIVLHLMPLRGDARDLFAHGHIVMIVTRLATGAMVPDTPILTGLFDLGASEARLARAISAGRALAEIAVEAGITLKTARTYLESGCSRRRRLTSRRNSWRF